jgi:hypothetical protein
MIAPAVSVYASLASLAAYLARNAEAPARAAGSAVQASSRPLLPGAAPARRTGGARRASASARRARSGRSSPAGYAPRTPSAKKTSSSKKSSAADPLAFLRDPKLSIEDKLIQLLGYLNRKWDKEMQDKMDRIAAPEAGKKQAAVKSGSSSSKKGSGGILGSLGSIGEALQSVIAPATAALQIPLVRDVLKQVGGPVLAAGATALGFPEAAPLLLKYGPEIVDAASKLATAVDGVAKGSSGSGSSSGDSRSSSSKSSSSDKALSDSEQQMLVMQIQQIQQKQQEMFGMVSNILKSNHDVRMAVVNNIR